MKGFTRSRQNEDLKVTRNGEGGLVEIGRWGCGEEADLRK